MQAWGGCRYAMVGVDICPSISLHKQQPRTFAAEIVQNQQTTPVVYALTKTVPKQNGIWAFGWPHDKQP